MTKAEEKTRRKGQHKGGSNGKHTKKTAEADKGIKVPAEPVQPASDTVATVAVQEETPATNQVQPPHNNEAPAGPAVADNVAVPPQPPKKTALTTEQALDMGLTKLVKDELRDQQELAHLDLRLGQLKEVIVSLGLEVPQDDDDTPQKKAPGKRGRKKGKVGRPPSSGKGKVGTGLWSIVRDHLAAKGFIDPKFEDASTINALAEKHGYSTAANLLSQKSKDGYLVKGDNRGEYALPKNWKSMVD